MKRRYGVRSVVRAILPAPVLRFIRKFRRQGLWGAFERGEWEKVANARKRAFERDPRSVPPHGYYQLAVSSWRMKDHPTALDAFDTGLRLYPGYRRLVREYRAFLNLHSDSNAAERASALLEESISEFARMAADPARDCTAMWQRLALVVNLGHEEIAYEMATSFLDTCPIEAVQANQTEVYRVCTVALRRSEHFKEAWQLLQRALVEHPDHPSLAIEAGRVGPHIGELEAVADIFASALVAHPDHRKLARSFRALLSRYQDPEVAECIQKLISDAVDLFEGQAAAGDSSRDCTAMWSSIALVVNLGHIEIADDMVRRFLRACPVTKVRADSPEVYRVCIMALRKNEHLEEAWQLVQRALGEHPHHPSLVVEAGRVARLRRDLNESLGFWTALAETGGENLSPRNGASLLAALLSGDRIVEADGICRQLRAVHGDHPLLARAHAKILMRAVWDHYNMCYVESAAGWAQRLEGLIDSRELCEMVAAGMQTYDVGSHAAQLYRRRAVKSLSVVLFGPAQNMSKGQRHEVADTIMRVVFWESSDAGHTLVQAAGDLLIASPDERSDALATFEREVFAVRKDSGIAASDLELLYRPLVWQGLFSLAYRVRKAGSELLIAEAALPDAASKEMDATLAACEFARSEVAAKWVSDLHTREDMPRVRRQAIAAYQRLLAGELTPLRELWAETLTPEEELFADYVRGRSIAIVAPAPGETENGSEIDAFDIVIRPNAYKSMVPSAFARHGSRTDVCSFNASRSRRLRQQGDRQEAVVEVADGIEVVLHKARYIQCHGSDIRFEVVRSRVKDLDQYTQGHGTHIPHLVFYLLGFAPSRVKMFNSNFFLSEMAHETSYRDIVAGDVGPLAYNDMVDVGHQFVRSVWTHGFIEADEEGSAVLSMDTSEYMAGMERLYGQR